MAARVQKIRQELQSIKAEAKAQQSEYKVKAEQRVAYQNKMAEINTMVQSRSRDTELIEDVIIVTLAAETAAHERYSITPEEPTTQPEQVQVGQRTKDAEEAVRIYQSQIDYFKEEMEYREALGMAERDMDMIYRKAIDDILDIMDSYCKDGRLRMEILRFSEGGDAPCSPRKPQRRSVFGKQSPGKNKSISDFDVFPKTPNIVSPSSSPRKRLSDMNASQDMGMSFMPPPLTDINGDDASGESDDEPLTEDEASENNSADEIDSEDEEQVAEHDQPEPDEQDADASGYDEHEEYGEESASKVQEVRNEEQVDEASAHDSAEQGEEASSHAEELDDSAENNASLSETGEAEKEQTCNDSVEAEKEAVLENDEILNAAGETIVLPPETQEEEKVVKKKKKKKKDTENDEHAHDKEEDHADEAKAKNKKKKKKSKEESEEIPSTEEQVSEAFSDAPGDHVKHKKKKKKKHTDDSDGEEAEPTATSTKKKKKKKKSKALDGEAEETSEELRTKKSKKQGETGEKKKKKKPKKKVSED